MQALASIVTGVNDCFQYRLLAKPASPSRRLLRRITVATLRRVGPQAGQRVNRPGLDKTKADMACRTVGRVVAAGMYEVAAAIGIVAKVRAAAHDAGLPLRRT